MAYTISVRNNGAAARDITVTLAYDPGVSFVTAEVPPDGGTTKLKATESNAKRPSVSLATAASPWFVLIDGCP